MTNDITKKLEEYFEAYYKAWPLSGTFLVAKDGEVLFKRAYGLANKELDVLNKVDTKFLICSITKTFTSVAIMMLHERGLLDIEESITKYLPKYPRPEKEVSIYNLLTHTSGIPSYTGEEGYVGKTERLYFTQEELIDRFKNKPLQFNPGERGEYSNSGYYLLGVIIEKVTGKSYEEFLNENIFKPLGMKDTGLYNQDMILKNRAYPYTFKGENYSNGRFVEMKNVFSGGGLYSTVDDMFLWDRALHGGKLITKESLDKIFTPFKNIDQTIPYGCGFFVTEIFNKKRVGHEGGLNGYLTQYYHFAKEDVTYIILGNIIQNIWKISDDIPAIIFGEDYEIPKKPQPISIDLETLDSYVGEYEDPQGDRSKFIRRGNRVFMELDDDNKFEVIPIAKNKFCHKLIEETYEFKIDEDGEYYFEFYGDKCKKVK